MSNDASEQITVIKPAQGWLSIDWKELSHYRDLFFFLVLRDVRVLYKQSVLGFLWAIIRPLLTSVVFVLIFNKAAGVSSDGAPAYLYSLCATVPFFYFRESLNKSIGSLVTNSDMMTKIYFPRLIIPITPTLAILVDLAISLVILFGFWAYYLIFPGDGPGESIQPVWAALPTLLYLIFLMMLFSGGLGMWLSALTIQYRDIRYANQFFMQLLLLVTPVAWPLSLLAEQFDSWVYYVYGLYPMAGVIAGFQSILTGATPVPWDIIGLGTITAIIIFLSGAFYFRRLERFFADVA